MNGNIPSEDTAITTMGFVVVAIIMIRVVVVATIRTKEVVLLLEMFDQTFHG